MTNEQLAQLKSLAQGLVDTMPAHITVNGKREIFYLGQQLDIVNLLSSIEITMERAHELNDVIQNLEGRKVRTK